MSDSEGNREQIAQLYANMGDEELRNLADEAWTLTDSGKDLLIAELARRGLDFALAEGPVPEVNAKDPVVFRRFRDLPDALLAKGILDSADVESFLIDETIVRMDWLWSNMVGGIKLWINFADADDATQLLKPDFPEHFNVEGLGEYRQPRCPQCQSLKISYEDLNRPITYAITFFAKLPIRIIRHRWTCHSCGHIWPPSDETTQSQ
jgi:hypothetical protein